MIRNNSSDKFIESNLVSQWVEYSERVQIARLSHKPSQVNTWLLETAEKDSGSMLSPLLTLWAGDNLKLEARHQEALEMYNLAYRYANSAQLFPGLDVIAAVLEAKASMYTKLRAWDDAINTFVGLAERHHRVVWSTFQIARTLEEAGRIDDAIVAYKKVREGIEAKKEDDNEYLIDLARRNAIFLQEGKGCFRDSTKELAGILFSALENNDHDILEGLASQSHFSIGVEGGHFEFSDRKELLDQLFDDLKRSVKRIRYKGLRGDGEKRYVLTKGWRGQWFYGRVSFLLAKTSRGWEWRGIALHQPTRKWERGWRPTKKETNQPLEMEISAPWPNGTAFMAGGLNAFLGQLFAIAVLAAVWFVGTILAAALTYGLSLRRCGFGTRGYYYNHGPTHRGVDAFAIDFTKYQTGAPFWNISGGTAVLAVAWGRVARIIDRNPSGDSSEANRVEIRHIRGTSRRGSWAPETGTVVESIETFFEPYESKYLHLAGPFSIPVSVGMSVRKGARLGTMNDTGTSVVDHLHFSIHDTRLGGNSVRPSPMDGHRLLDGDDGSCIRSFNRPFP